MSSVTDEGEPVFAEMASMENMEVDSPGDHAQSEAGFTQDHMAEPAHTGPDGGPSATDRKGPAISVSQESDVTAGVLAEQQTAPAPAAEPAQESPLAALASQAALSHDEMSGTVAQHTDTAARGADAVAQGADAVAQGADAVAQGADAVAQGADAVAQGTDSAAQDSDTATKGPEAAPQGADSVAQEVVTATQDACTVQGAGTVVQGDGTAAQDVDTAAERVDEKPMHTAPTVLRDASAAAPTGYQPVGGDLALFEDELAPPTADPTADRVPAVPVAPLDRVQMLNTLLAGRPGGTTITPCPSRLQMPLPRDGFMCDQCSDRFVLPSSLALHQSRRTARIAFKCADCHRTLVFDNKCRFLEHLDLHDKDPQTLDPESVDVCALAAADLSSQARIIPTQGGQVVTGPPKLIQMGPVKKPDKPVYVSCPMCNTLCSAPSLATHMCPPTGPDALETVPPRCPECAQPCPSECSLMAHFGLHKPNLFPYPYVCPECSLKVLGSHDEYRRHVVATCLHLTRDLKTCCAICLIEVGDVKSHMLQAHVQKLFKCRKCPLAFESINGFNSHITGKHSHEPMLGETPYMPILKCPFCAATFNQPKTLRDHLSSKKHGERVLEQVRFVFRCPECDVDYGRKELLSDHLTQKHPDFKIAVMDLPEPDPEPEPAPAPVPAPAPSPEEAPAPTAGPTARPAARAAKNNAAVSVGQRGVAPPALVKLESSAQAPTQVVRKAVLHACIVCQAPFSRKSAYLEHARQHLSDGEPLCLLCNAHFDSQEVLKHHIADHASEIGRDRCGLCYAKLGSRDALQYHLEAEHNLRNFTCTACQLRFSRLNDLHRHNFTKHRSGAKGRPPPPLPARDVPPSPQDANANTNAGVADDDDDDDDDDDLPLSELGARKLRAGPPSGVDGLGEPESEASSVVSDADTEAGGDWCKRPAARTPGRGGKRARVDVDGMPRLSRVSKRSQSPDEAAFVERPAPALPASGYRCVCCGLQTDARAQFVAHVAQHRQPGQHQCPECGQCYSTKPSLLKHLLLVHRLRQPPPELAEAERQHEAQKWEQLTKDLEPGQCHVCRAQCGDDARLQLHLRAHGRAAVRAHQRQQQRRQQRRQSRQQQQQDRAETLEDIASYVAGSGAGEPQEDADEDEVIELEMKDGEVTQKQLRKAGVALVRPDDSSEDEEVALQDAIRLDELAQGNGRLQAADEPQPEPADAVVDIKARTAAVTAPAAVLIEANGHPQGEAVQGEACG